MSDLFPEINDWPGNRPPKNRPNNSQQKTVTENSLTGLRGKIYRIKGEDVELFTIGDLSAALNKRPVTIRMWESKGWIPRANWRSPAPQGEQIPGKPAKGRRLYTRRQVELLTLAVDIYRLDNKAEADWVGFRSFIKENWPI